METKLIPSLWFNAPEGDINTILAYYQYIFAASFEVIKITDLGETPSGKTQIATVTFFGQAYSFMNTEKEHMPFNDAFALTILCKDQAEIDYFWNYFTKDGKEVQCGWCIDKYGLRWQVIPNHMDQLMSKPDSWNVMMRQKKIIISDY